MNAIALGAIIIFLVVVICSIEIDRNSTHDRD